MHHRALIIIVRNVFFLLRQLLLMMSMWKRGKDTRMMALIYVICLLVIRIEPVEAIKEIIVESPFYLRARVHDSQTASILFEIARGNNQRECQMYQFTIGRNREHPYSMPEQNLDYWRNSLELKHLDMGDYRVCAIICSEHLRNTNLTHENFNQTNHSIPITACVNIHAYRSHFLILTLYILVFVILTFSQIIFTLRKRKVHARIKSALIEVESALQKWRSAQSSLDHTQSYTILQSLITIPAAPVEHSKTSQLQQPTTDEHRPSHPIIFHIENSSPEIP